MQNRLTLEPGEIVRFRDRCRTDVMSFYIFREWTDVPEHIRAGRIARLTWCYNGTPSSGWEADITSAGPTDRDALREMIAAEHATNPCNAAVPCVS